MSRYDVPCPHPPDTWIIESVSELRAAVGVRVPPTAAGVAVGAFVAAVTAATLLRPQSGLYLAQAAALVTAVVVAGLALFTVGLPAGPAYGAIARLIAALAVVAFAAALLTVPFVVMAVAGDGLRGLGSGLAWADVLRSGDYETVVARGAGAVLVVLAARAPAGGGQARLAAAAGAVLVAGSLLLTGHTRTHGPAAAVIAAGLAHVLAASAWCGGLVGLGVSLRTVRGDTLATGRLLAWFARMMSVVLTLLIAGGVGLAYLYLSGPRALVDTAYGQVLLVKLAVIAGALVISTANHVRLVPLAARGNATAVRVLRTNVAVEQIALVAVLVITAVLMGQNPGG